MDIDYLLLLIPGTIITNRNCLELIVLCTIQRAVARAFTVCIFAIPILKKKISKNSVRFHNLNISSFPIMFQGARP